MWRLFDEIPACGRQANLFFRPRRIRLRRRTKLTLLSAVALRQLADRHPAKKFSSHFLFCLPRSSLKAMVWGRATNFFFPFCNVLRSNAGR